MLITPYPGKLIVADLYPASQRCLCLIFSDTNLWALAPNLPDNVKSLNLRDSDNNTFPFYLTLDDIASITNEKNRETEDISPPLRNQLRSSKIWYMWETDLHMIANMKYILSGLQ